MKRIRANYAVTEIISTLLTIGLAVTTFTAVSIVIMNPYINTDPSETSLPSVTIVGSVERDNITLEHRGGIALSNDTKIILYIAGSPVQYTAQSCDDDGNGLWNIGEQFSYQGDLEGKNVNVTVIDIETNSIIMEGVLQSGTVAVVPWVETKAADVCSNDSAILMMVYGFIDYSGYIRFTYQPEGSSWKNTTWMSKSGTAMYGCRIDIIEDTRYSFKAQLKYYNGSGWEWVNGSKLQFSSGDWKRGIWYFDEDHGDIARDSSLYDNDGTLKPSGDGPQWTDGINQSALSFDGIDDYVEVLDNESLDITDSITIKAWMYPNETGGTFAGKINEIENLSIESEEGGGEIEAFYEPDMIHVFGKIYAIACRTKEYPYLITLKIDNSGHIDDFVDDSEVKKPDLLPVPFNNEPDIYLINWDQIQKKGVYAIAYGSDQVDSGCLLTLTINYDGQIDHTIDYLEFEEYYGIEPHIVHVNGNIYAISYGGSPNPEIDTGYLITVSITDAGIISDSVKSTWHLPYGPPCYENDIIKISEKSDHDIYALTYRAGNQPTEGFVITVKIPYTGIFTPTENYLIGTLDFDIDTDNFGWEPSMTLVDWDYSSDFGVYAISFGGSHLRGWMMTIKIDGDGHFIGSQSNGIIETLTFDTPSNWLESEILHVRDDIYVIATSSMDAAISETGYLITLIIPNSGEGMRVLHTLRLAGLYGEKPSIVHINSLEDEEIFAIAYGGSRVANSNGFFVTVGIDLIDQTKGVIVKEGAYEISAIGTSVFATINGETISGEIHEGRWNFIVLTYDKTAYSKQMKLYIDTELVEEVDFLESIATNPNNLIFGKYGCILDQVAIYSIAISYNQITSEYSEYSAGAQHAGAGRLPSGVGPGDGESGDLPPAAK